MKFKPFVIRALFAACRVLGLPAGLWVLWLCADGRLRELHATGLLQTVSLSVLAFVLTLRLAERWRAESPDLAADADAAADQPREKPAAQTAQATIRPHPLHGRLAQVAVKPGRTPWSAATVLCRRILQDPRLRETELGMLLLAAGYALTAATGGPQSPLAPLVFVGVLLLGCYTSRTAALLLLLVVSATEIGTWALPETRPFSLPHLGTRVSLLWLCGLCYPLLLYVNAFRRRSLSRRGTRARLEGLQRDVRLFRLEPAAAVGPEPESRLNEQEQDYLSAVGSVRHSLEHLLEMSCLAFAPALHSLLLFFVDKEDYSLRKGISSSESLVLGSIPRGRGVLGMVDKRNETVILQEIPNERTLLPYYRFHENISRVAALPIRKQGQLMGILLADRREKTDFSGAELRSLTVLAEEVLRLIEYEWLLLDLRKQKEIFEKFHRIAHGFNHTRRSGEVAAAAISAAQDICGAEFAALTAHDPAAKEDFILAARWSEHDLDPLGGRRLMPDAGLVSKAIKLGRPLPEDTALRPQQVLFDPSIPTAELAGAKVFPLLSGDRALGALVVGDMSAHFLSPHTEHMLEVLADHAALALAQADLFEQLEQLATTDGLTGLANHRYFELRLEEAFRRARRYNKHVSLLILDIDHFKAINDRYGHLAGDQVLRAVGETLSRLARETDVVARYGGEEFAIIMEETDGKGGLQAAERIRRAIASHEFPAADSLCRCTLSVGVASYPAHAPDRNSLVAFADQALYDAKRSGRNRVVSYGGESAAATGT